MKYVLILLSLCLLGCTSKPQFTYKAWDLPQIPIKYKQKVNGYNVSVLCFLGDSVAYDQNKALFYFENDSSYFYVYNPSFHIGMLLGEDFQIGDSFFLDYTYPETTTELPDNDVPFFFQDVDFDGEDELLITKWQLGSRGSSRYDVYDLDKYDGYSIDIPQKTEEPFTLLENYKTTFDYEQKEIIMRYWEPYDMWKYVYKKVEYEDVTICDIDTLSRFDKIEMDIYTKKRFTPDDCWGWEQKIYQQKNNGFAYKLIKHDTISDLEEYFKTENFQ